MGTLFVTLGGLLAFFLGYRYYARFLASRIFKLDPDFRTPAHELQDGIDYVPTSRWVLWGHHFASVAGAAPIIGPAIAMIWGWLPALLWVLFGTVFIAGIHDFGTLWASVRNKGQSVGSIAASVINPRARSLFLLIIFFLILIVNAVFAVAIGTLFTKFPSSVLPYWLQIPVAMAIGWLVYRRGVDIVLPALGALVLLLGFVFLGSAVPLSLPASWLGLPSTAWWVLIMLAYCSFASRLPVWLLLQPRDFINSHLLFFCLAVLYLGLFVGRPDFVAPAFNRAVPADAPPLLPLLFVTIACGAISGFHGLVSSGTSSKQLDKETDARLVGYLGSIGEGLLALIAIMATAAGLASTDAWQSHYGSWAEASTGGIAVFVTGAGNLLSHLGIAPAIGTTLVATMVVAFAATSLDTSMRLQRFILKEIGTEYRMPALQNTNIATAICFFACLALAFLADPSNPGAGGMVLWPLFGTTNQLTAALSLLILTLLLHRLRRGYIYSLIPFVLVATMTLWSMVFNIRAYLSAGNYLLVSIGGIIFALNVWLLLEGFGAARRARSQAPAAQDLS
ncbi:MAG: carbon starvation protein A [Pseudomonadota bacterium]|nr:carbon starvation protein A [Pseudomonadota bacterium]